MQGHLANREFDSVVRFSGLLSQVRQLETRAKQLDVEVSDIETRLSEISGESTSELVAGSPPQVNGAVAPSPEGGRAGPRTLRIEIDWKANNRLRDHELIISPKAVEGMVRFLGRLVEELGDEALQRISRIHVNRGPLISKSPEVDFLNKTKNEVYGHRKLPGTEYFVLTHSSTSQKRDDLIRVCRELGLVADSVKIQAIDRADSYAEL